MPPKPPVDVVSTSAIAKARLDVATERRRNADLLFPSVMEPGMDAELAAAVTEVQVTEALVAASQAEYETALELEAAERIASYATFNDWKHAIKAERQTKADKARRDADDVHQKAPKPPKQKDRAIR